MSLISALLHRPAAKLAGGRAGSTGIALAAALLLAAAGPAAAQLMPSGKLPGAGPTPRIAPGAAPACGDWWEAGRADAARGLRRAYFARARDCAEGDRLAGLIRYEAGYAAGLAAYCAPENGFRVGALNLAYEGVCPPEAEAAFLDAYRRGLARRAADDGHDAYWWKGVLVPHFLIPDRRKHPPLIPPKPRRPRLDDLEPPAVRPVPGDEPPDWRRLWRREPPAARLDPDREEDGAGSGGWKDDRRRDDWRKPRREPEPPPAARPAPAPEEELLPPEGGAARTRLR